MKDLIITFVFFFSLSGNAFAQGISPAPPQSQPIVVTGGTAHLGNGTVIENALIIFENGKFTSVGSADKIAAPKGSQYQYIDASGKQIYPGFIALNSQIGLIEIGAVRATRDQREVGQMNPSIRAAIAYNTDSEVTPTIRSNGILYAEAVPGGGRISGQSSLMQLDAWNWEDAIVGGDVAIYTNWPSINSWDRSARKLKKNEKYAQQVMELESFLKEAQSYSTIKNPQTTNLKFEAMRGIFRKEKRLMIKANNAQSIMEAVLFAKRFEITPVIVGGREAWKMADFLSEQKVPVVLRRAQNLPGKEDFDIDQPFKSAKMLMDKGVLVALTDDGFWEQRNLPFQAGQSVAFGLEKEKAIQAITLNPAQILGLADKIGSIEKGKNASFFISEGDALDMRSNLINKAFIDGRAINLTNKQKKLSEKFRAKYQAEKSKKE